jgi:cell division protein FtsL
MMKAKAILLNKKEAKKKFFSYLSDKIIIPIVVASLIAIATSFITTKYQNNEINKKVESLEKEIIWLKEQK